MNVYINVQLSDLSHESSMKDMLWQIGSLWLIHLYDFFFFRIYLIRICAVLGHYCDCETCSLIFLLSQLWFWGEKINNSWMHCLSLWYFIIPCVGDFLSSLSKNRWFFWSTTCSSCAKQFDFVKIFKNESWAKILVL